MEDANRADNLLRQIRRRRSKPQKIQIEQTIHQGIGDADGVDEAQTADADRTSHGRRRQSRRLIEA